MASPSDESWMSTSIEKLPAIAACTAPGMFSTMPREMSCRPRWATGRAVSQSGARNAVSSVSGDLEHAFDLDRRIRGQRGDADGGAGVAALVTEGGDHQVGGAVENLRPIQEVRRRVDEAAEAHNAHDLVEIAERRLDLGQQVDGAAAGGRGAVFDGHAGAELALGDQLAGRIEANLARDEQQVTGAHERHVIGHGGRGLMQL